MAKVAILALLVLSILGTNAGPRRVPRQAIPPEFRNINIENYLKNQRAVLFQLKCLIYDGPCDRIGKYLKVTIPELLTNQCRNCNVDQRKQAGRMVAFIQQNYPMEWVDAVKKFQGGKTISAAEVKRFEEQFGIKAVGIVTEPSASVNGTTETGTGTMTTTPTTTTARISIEEIGQIVREAQKEYNKMQQQQPATNNQQGPIVPSK